jgi:hypothetical protein
MIDWLAHYTFGLGENALAEIDPMEPGFQEPDSTQNFIARHVDQRVWRMAAAACSAPLTSIRISGSGMSGE